MFKNGTDRKDYVFKCLRIIVLVYTKPELEYPILIISNSNVCIFTFPNKHNKNTYSYPSVIDYGDQKYNFVKL